MSPFSCAPAAAAGHTGRVPSRAERAAVDMSSMSLVLRLSRWDHQARGPHLSAGRAAEGRLSSAWRP